MTLGNPWMVEVIGRVVGHSQLFHDADGANVDGRGPGVDLVQSDSIEPIVDSGCRGLGRKALTPVRAVEPPAYLHRGREVGWKVVVGKSPIAYELADAGHLDRPQPITATAELGFDSVGECVRLGASERRWEVLHDDGIRVEPRERLPV